REISVLGAYEQLWQPPGCVYRHLDFVPLAVGNEIRGLVTNRVLMAQLKRDLLEDIVHLSTAARIESLSARHSRQFVEGALAFHAQRAAYVAAAKNSDRI